MSEYDFKSLSPYDFELLCRDLLQKEYGVHLQSFKTGRDGGIDLRYAPDRHRTLIVQCKHYAGSSYSVMLGNLENEELAKVRRLNPPRYILTTSLGLNPQQKETLYQLFSPFCMSSQDIYGQQDLNNLLGKYPDIERNQFKLWLTSIPVLERVLHNMIYLQSSFDREDIHRRLKLFVQTQAVNKARELLEKEHCCIISGIPGIGKTTLAQILLVRYLMNGWNVVTIRQNVSEGLDGFDPNPQSKQVFWYDDFLGQISFGDKLAKNEDVALLQLIRNVAKHHNRRFILTTREYILHQAKQNYEALSRSNVEVIKYTLKLDEYSLKQKARILLNHLYFCGVPPAHIDALITGKTYRDIINHKNYSPRIIEWTTDIQRVKESSPTSYASFFLKSLDDPSSLWAHAFDNQIRKSSQLLLMTLATCGREVQIDDLRNAFMTYLGFCANKYKLYSSPNDFREALQELESTFIRIMTYKNGTTIGFHNPSVLDFLVGRIRETPYIIQDIICAATYFEQLEKLINMLTNGNWNDKAFEGMAYLSNEITESYIKTFDAPSITLFPELLLSYARRIIIKQRNSAERLIYGIKLCRYFKRKELEKNIIDKMDSYIGEISVIAPIGEEVIRVLNAVTPIEWIPINKKQEWQEIGKAYLIKGPNIWEDIDPIFEWLDSHNNVVNESEIDEYYENARRFIADEIREAVTEEHNVDVLEEKVSDLGRWTSRLGNGLELEMCKLNSRIQNLGSEYEPDLEDDSPEDNPSSQEEFDIDSMFDSLRS